RELATSIKDLVHAQKESPMALAGAAKVTSSQIPRMAEVAKQLAGSVGDPDKQQLHLGLAKAIADATLSLLQGCKQNDPKEIATQARGSSQAIAKLLSALKGGVLALRDCVEASRAVL